MIVCALLGILAACDAPWNDPYPKSDESANVLYGAFNERPKHLDPVQSYSSNEVVFTAQIYTPPLQYHYLLRPYRLMPFAAEAMPTVTFLGSDGRTLPRDVDPQRIAFTVYEVHIRRGMRYQPHPAFAVDAQGHSAYSQLTSRQLEDIHDLRDFAKTGFREVTADDFVYEIKRLASPRLHSPILGLMGQYIVGLDALAKTLRTENERLARSGDAGQWLDLRRFPLEGVEVVDRYTYRIRLKGRYPQFAYWLAMPFFAPVPAEVDRFYSQPGLIARNITLDWYPVGAGPYMMTRNDPNREIVLERNPNYFGEPYPRRGEPADEAEGLLADAGKRMPFIDRAVYSLEKESIPYWNKFLQGYYDASGISSDAFDQAVQLSATGDAALTDEMRRRGIVLKTAVLPSTYYMGFNMLDGVVGGTSERARKLRQAISIAVDYEEYIAIFANGRGIAAQGPLPPGIFGYRGGQAGMNPYVYDWVDGRPRRKPLSEARQLMAEAGYADGVDHTTGQSLVLYLDATARGPDDKARLDWLRKQFAKLHVNLVVRATDYNRFQEKIRKGNAQIFYWGWNADYPDPENFLFLLFGPQSKVTSQGENASNYSNPEFDHLFEEMKDMDDGPVRQRLIDRMIRIAQHDAPWIWGMHPKDYVLSHGWLHNRKPNQIANNVLKYQRLDATRRADLRLHWNRPVVWPLGLGLLAVLLGLIPAIVMHRRREHLDARDTVAGAAEGGPR